MTAVLYLVRHAAHDDVGGFLAGRKPGVTLGQAGRAQAARLGERMRRESFDGIVSSPRERTRETAEAIAAATGIGPIETAAELDEIAFGSWSGRTFADLDGDPEWRRWNTVRSLVRTPGGETMRDVQKRAVDLIERVCGDSRRLVLVTHADVIKAVALFVLGAPLDCWMRLDVAPASITTIVPDPWGWRLVGLNETVD